MIKAFSRIKKKTTYNPTLLGIAAPCAPGDTPFSHISPLWPVPIGIAHQGGVYSSFQFRDPARHATLTLAAFDADLFLLHHKLPVLTTLYIPHWPSQCCILIFPILCELSCPAFESAPQPHLVGGQVQSSRKGVRRQTLLPLHEPGSRLPSAQSQLWRRESAARIPQVLLFEDPRRKTIVFENRRSQHLGVFAGREWRLKHRRW